MENLVNFIKQHTTKEIFEPIRTSTKDYAITGCLLSGINYDDCAKICKELNEALAKLSSVPQANELLPHVSKMLRESENIYVTAYATTKEEFEQFLRDNYT